MTATITQVENTEGTNEGPLFAPLYINTQGILPFKALSIDSAIGAVFPGNISIFYKVSGRQHALVTYSHGEEIRSTLGGISNHPRINFFDYHDKEIPYGAINQADDSISELARKMLFPISNFSERFAKMSTSLEAAIMAQLPIIQMKGAENPDMHWILLYQQYLAQSAKEIIKR